MILRLLLVCHLILPGSWCLKSVVMWAPEMVRAGTTLQLICHYDLEDSDLYSIKFYQGDQEFYRYVPKEAPPTRVFALPGIQVDIFQSNATVVTLNNVQKEMSGLYKCEVSADAPSFHTVIRSTNIVVIEKPVTIPEVRVEKTKYNIGEKIRANCTSRSSFPAANLTFYVNTMQLHPSDLTRLHRYVKSERGGLETSLLELETIAVPSMFTDGKFRLRCIATQYNLYRKGADAWLHEDTPQLAHVLGPSHPNFELDESHGSRTFLDWRILAVLLGLLFRR
ncbi:uncharacterized protein LOC106674224 [Cimex lectularius]|uniref:Ig-like domain-containing protein n=1 Tax=Cimex lectularius TaxID=79782 RepID=A0A8I6SDE6_CIMLE|nr:uncharacterized protein LOC106674224 [Cimex lectularius]